MDHAVEELERCVKELGFKGWNTHSNFGDSYLDEKQYWPLLAKCEELDVPIYLHPAVPMIPQLREFGMVLAGPTFGFGVGDGLRLHAHDRARRLRPVPQAEDHHGALRRGLPLPGHRVDRAYMQQALHPNPEIGPGSKEWASHYVQNNLWVTTSGNYLARPSTARGTGWEWRRSLLGTDFPYERMDACTTFLDGLGLPEDELAQVYEANARALGF